MKSRQLKCAFAFKISLKFSILNERMQCAEFAPPVLSMKPFSVLNFSCLYSRGGSRSGNKNQNDFF